MAGLDGQESVGSEFGSCAEGEKALTVRELLETPIQDWVAKAGEGCMPSDMSNFSRNMERQIDRTMEMAERNISRQVDRIFDGQAPRDPSRDNPNVAEIYEAAKNSALEKIGIDPQEFDALNSREQRDLLDQQLENVTPEQREAFSQEIATQVSGMTEGMGAIAIGQLQEVQDKLEEAQSQEPATPASPEASNGAGQGAPVSDGRLFEV